ncbi:hypothetical protein KCP73_07345 [Salmonella enterica subsp. enterica]|nr:hypothetical protein KCP73_07345 [Salmonella enterica subsp. enterica]
MLSPIWLQRATAALAGKRLSKHCYYGFYGRTALFEVLTVTPALPLIASGVSAQALEAHLQQRPVYRDAFENGCRAVEQGMTSLKRYCAFWECPMSVVNSLALARQQR